MTLKNFASAKTNPSSFIFCCDFTASAYTHFQPEKTSRFLPDCGIHKVFLFFRLLYSLFRANKKELQSDALFNLCNILNGWLILLRQQFLLIEN